MLQFKYSCIHKGIENSANDVSQYMALQTAKYNTFLSCQYCFIHTMSVPVSKIFFYIYKNLIYVDRKH